MYSQSLYKLWYQHLLQSCFLYKTSCKFRLHNVFLCLPGIFLPRGIPHLAKPRVRHLSICCVDSQHAYIKQVWCMFLSHPWYQQVWQCAHSLPPSVFFLPLTLPILRASLSAFAPLVFLENPSCDQCWFRMMSLVMFYVTDWSRLGSGYRESRSQFMWMEVLSMSVLSLISRFSHNKDKIQRTVK